MRAFTRAFTRAVPRTLAVVSASLVIAACGDIAKLLAPGAGTGAAASRAPTQVAFTARFTRTPTTRSSVVTLDVATHYLRRGGTRVSLGSATHALDDQPTQSLPLAIDVAACLADPERDVAALTDGACPVVISLSLRVDGIVVDEQAIGPLQLRPGATTTVADPVTLFEIDSVAVSVGAGGAVAPGGEVRVVLGGSASLGAQVFDARGAAVDGRAVTWHSDAPAVATVDAGTGTITAVSVGTARIEATLGAVRAAVTVRVLRPPALLTIAPSTGSGSGRVRSTPAGIDCDVRGTSVSGACAFTFPGDDVVLLTSTADASSLFASWGDACVGVAIGPSCQVAMSQPRTASARFLAVRRVHVDGGASDAGGRVTGTSGIDCRISGTSTSGVCAVDVPDGSTVSLVAVPDGDPSAPTTFVGWAGDCAGSAGPTCDLVVNGTGRVGSAHFFANKPLSVSVTGVGGGRVSGAGIDCVRATGAVAGRCSASFAHGTAVSLSAAADDQSVFAGWSGACSGQAATCVVAVDRAQAVGAQFRRSTTTLTITVHGTGAGVVSVNGTVACTLAAGQAQAACSQELPAGASVTVTAVASPGSRFDGFGGDCAGTSCTLTLGDPRTVSASFSRDPVPITLVLNGSGAGSVLANGTIACTLAVGQVRSACAFSVDSGSVVTVVATSANGSVFDGFSGPCAGNACQFTVHAPTTVDATFSRAPVPLTIVVAPGGGGTVRIGSSAPCVFASSSVAASCTRDVAVTAPTTVSATAATGSTFTGFGTPCGAGSTCVLSVSGAMSLTASFAVRQLHLSVTGASGSTGAGGIEGSGLQCNLLGTVASGGCSVSVPFGTAVTITAQAGANSALSAWGGACAGTMTMTCTFVASDDASISVQFLAAITATVTIVGSGAGTVDLDLPGVPAQPSCMFSGSSSTCTFAVPFGLSGVIQGSALPGSTFRGFTGFCERPGTGPFQTCSFRGVGFSRSLTATFSQP